MTKALVCVAPLLVPATHRVILLSIEEGKSKVYPGQMSLVFTFSSEQGVASRVTGATLRYGDALHQTLSELAGRSIAVGEEITLEGFIGRQYDIDVVAKGTHGIHIESIRPVVAG